MARCLSCQKELGFFEKKIAIFVGGKREFFCPSCAEKWPSQQKENAISALYSGGEPSVVFMIPRVTTQYQDDPGKELLGYLLFTNKAVCFAQFAEVNLNNSAFAYGGGLLGAAIGAAVQSSNKKKAWVQVGSGETGPLEFKRILDRCSRLIVFPKETITEIRYKNAIEIKMGKRSQYFGIEGNKKEIAKQFEPLVLGYLNIR